MRRSIFIRSRSTRLGAKDFLWRYVAAAQQRSSSLRSSARKHSSQPPPSYAECGGSLAFFSSIPILGCTILCHSDTDLRCSVLQHSLFLKSLFLNSPVPLICLTICLMLSAFDGRYTSHISLRVVVRSSSLRYRSLRHHPRTAPSSTE